MHYAEAKVYFDGSHYIAIPHTERPVKKRPKQYEETITVVEEKEVKKDLEEDNFKSSLSTTNNQIIEDKNKDKQTVKVERRLTKKELFEELYFKYIDLRTRQRKEKIYEEMLPYFSKEEYCKDFVNVHFDRKLRNLICRRVRMCRKANLAGFNYFCTFTYDDKKHTEESFRQKLKYCFANFCTRKKWKYMGVWERAPITNRLHFHGLFNIPENTLPGELLEVRDYDTTSHRIQTSYQSSYFNENFGRSDFKDISINDKELGKEIAYLMKYIEKTGEKIVYSKNLPQYFISDILECDIACRIGQEDKKLLLLDDFTCLDEGVVMGKVSPEVIEQMRKCN